MTNSADQNQLASEAIQKPSDLHVHCLQRQGTSGFSRTKVKVFFCFFLFFFLASKHNLWVPIAEYLDAKVTKQEPLPTGWSGFLQLAREEVLFSHSGPQLESHAQWN